jgi:outer membrane biosynthesis protein TonB
VNPDGDVCEEYIFESSGWALFDLFALDVAEHWHCRPGMYKGKPIGMWMNWTVSYSFGPPVDGK